MLHSHRVPVLPASGRKDDSLGTVVSAHERSVQAGLAMLQLGGNAIDAAVATALVAGVIEPAETTLAGCGFLLVNVPGDGQWSVDFGPRAPLAATPDMYEIDEDAGPLTGLGIAPVIGAANVHGALAPGVPRTLLSLVVTLERFGKLDRATVFGPAIDAARNGFISDSWFKNNALYDIEYLRADKGASESYLDNGDLPKGWNSSWHAGESAGVPTMVKQEALAKTLETIVAEGAESLISGTIAQQLLETHREMGGLLTAEDLANATPTIERPLTIDYRGVQVSVPRAPGGGISELQMLRIWEALYPDGSPKEDSPERMRNLGLALRHAFADRYHWLGDPDFVPVPIDGLLSPEYAKSIADEIRSGGDVPATGPIPPWVRYASEAIHNPWDFDNSGQEPVQWAPGKVSAVTSGTTHLSTADADGMIVSITHTAANPFGNHMVCPRSGLLLDTQMAWFNAMPGAANSIAGGARPLANMGPAIITKDDKSVAALGSSGGRRILSAVAQVVINIVDRDMSALEALQSPRIDGSGSQLLVHENLADDLSSVQDMDPFVISLGNQPYQMDFARMNVAAYLGDGKTESAMDPKGYNS